mgnify:CR=1 FL=1
MWNTGYPAPSAQIPVCGFPAPDVLRGPPLGTENSRPWTPVRRRPRSFWSSPPKAAQVDFGAGPRLLDERSEELCKSGVFVMPLCHSRHQCAEIIWRQGVSSWLEGHRHASACSAGIGRAIRKPRSFRQPRWRSISA